MPPASSIVTPGIAKLFDQTLPADTSVWDTGQVIHPSYTTLRLLLIVKGTVASQTVYMRFNNDSGTNYQWGNLFTSGTSAAGGSTQNPGSAGAIAFYGAAGTNEATTSEVTIPWYSGTTFEKAYQSYSYFTNPGSASYGGHWSNTAAINQIQIVMGSGNVKTGSRLIIYGMV